MEVVLTGTGTPIPDANRAGPSTLVKAGDAHLLVDAGRGVVMRLAAAGSGPPLLAAVLITHLHSDHVCALNDVITTHWVMSQENATLKIYGPVGTEQFVERQMHALEPDIGYRVEHHDFLTHGPRLEVTDLEPGDAFTVGDVQITTAATEHSPVKPTIGFRLEHDGAVVALAGDTLPCDGVDELARGADTSSRPPFAATSSNPSHSRGCRTSSTTTPASSTRPAPPPASRETSPRPTASVTSSPNAE